MLQFLLRRLLQAIPTIFGISILAFGIMVAAPGGPTAAMKLDPRLSTAQREKAQRELGVRDSVAIQYLRWLIGDDWYTYEFTDDDGTTVEKQGESKGILRGDFGRSFTHRRPVFDLMKDKIQPTAELGLFSLFFSFLLGIPVGILAAIKPNGIFDNITRVFAVVFSAVPQFLLGLMLLLAFGSYLGWLPLGGRCPVSISGECSLADRAERLILPVFALSTGGIAVLSRYTRSSMLDVLNKDYVRTARAKGLSGNAVFYRHAFRNAMIPLATFLGPAIPGILGGAVVIEQIFSWQGLGRVALEATLQQDYPVVMAFVIFGGISTIIGYLISDVLYAWIDPRIRLG
ncbi:MAG TPA: ABC transporter permease [Aggregatilineales bacterium]|nr:ABC transporter permease [Aggregatilineales bacterium]